MPALPDIRARATRPSPTRSAGLAGADELQSRYRKIGIAAVAGALAATRSEPPYRAGPEGFPGADFYRAAWRAS